MRILHHRDIAERDDADEAFLSVQDRQAPDLDVRHIVRHTIEILVLIAVLHLWAHDLTDGSLRSMTSGNCSDCDIAVGDHPDQTITFPDREDPGVDLRHHLGRVLDALVRTNYPHVAGHDFSYAHVLLPSVRLQLLEPQQDHRARDSDDSCGEAERRHFSRVGHAEAPDRAQERPPPAAAPSIVACSTSTWVSGVNSGQMACTSDGRECFTFPTCPRATWRDRMRNTAPVALRALIGRIWANCSPMICRNSSSERGFTP